MRRELRNKTSKRIPIGGSYSRGFSNDLAEKKLQQVAQLQLPVPYESFKRPFFPTSRRSPLANFTRQRSIANSLPPSCRIDAELIRRSSSVTSSTTNSANPRALYMCVCVCVYACMYVTCHVIKDKEQNRGLNRHFSRTIRKMPRYRLRHVKALRKP